ncbi:MAG: hypothetical protein LBG15_14190 [Dysgonamonadaceae bacterium]|jgi:tetratricopeptide (TPR) repeat protein|nr:hypothetical protein [Dysgonamonadaceae bacterium]
MRNFSIIPNSSQSALEQYTDFLSKEVYCGMQPPYDVNDPLFLQQVGVLQAENIRKAINTNSAVSYAGFHETNATLVNSANFIGDKIGSVANMLTSSLDRGFGSLNHSLINIDSGINTVNKNLNTLGNITAQGFTALNTGINTANAQLSNVNKNLNAIENAVGQGLAALDSNLFALRNMVGQGFSNLYTQLRMSNNLLNNILTELKIPETQRERRYHVEEGAKYLSNALAKGHKLYFEDAFDEFNKAIAIERKDFFSWFNLGVIYLRSKEHIDISKAIEAFERFIHYAQAEAMHKKNQNLEYQIDDAHLYLAESYYLQQNFSNAVSETEHCKRTKNKADFMKVKYLSATNEKANRQEASEILLQLINNNPYVALQVLDDDDIVRNEIIVKLLDKLRKDTTKEANSLLQKLKKNIKNNYHIKQIKDKIKETQNLLQKQTFLDSYEAIVLMEKEHEWKTRNDATFTSTILDFESKEQEAFDKREESQRFELGEKIRRVFNEVNTLYYSKRYEEAVKCYDNAFKLAPCKLEDDTYLSLLICYGWCLLKLQMHTEAIEAFNTVLLLDKRKQYLWVYLEQARYFEYLKKYEEAIKCHETYLNLNSSDFSDYMQTKRDYIQERIAELEKKISER